MATPMPLKSDVWKDDARLQNAATQPYRSMQQDHDTSTSSLQKFQTALLMIGGSPLSPVPGGVGNFGSYNLPDTEFDPENADMCYYGSQTKKFVTDLQTKFHAARPDTLIDGKAGMQTLHFMDELLQIWIDGWNSIEIDDE